MPTDQMDLSNGRPYCDQHNTYGCERTECRPVKAGISVEELATIHQYNGPVSAAEWMGGSAESLACQVATLREQSRRATQWAEQCNRQRDQLAEENGKLAAQLAESEAMRANQAQAIAQYHDPKGLRPGLTVVKEHASAPTHAQAFKVGDRVKYIGSTFNIAGREGTIENFRQLSGECNVVVVFDDDVYPNGRTCYPKSLRAVSSPVLASVVTSHQMAAPPGLAAAAIPERVLAQAMAAMGHPCPDCHGSGEYVGLTNREPCRSCTGGTNGNA